MNPRAPIIIRVHHFQDDFVNQDNMIEMVDEITHNVYSIYPVSEILRQSMRSEDYYKFMYFQYINILEMMRINHK